MMGVELGKVDESKYLGIILQQDLRWNKQSIHATRKATKILNFVRRNFHHTSQSIKEKLYHTLVRPHLDYAIAAWDPYTSKNIHQIENVQKRAARFVTNTYGRDTSITSILKSLDWTNLKERRKQYRLLGFYKILNGQLDINYDSYITPKEERARRGHNKQFQIHQTRTDAYANSFFSTYG